MRQRHVQEREMRRPLKLNASVIAMQQCCVMKRKVMIIILPVFFLVSVAVNVFAGDGTFSPVTVTTEKLMVTGGAPAPLPAASAGPVTITTEKLTATAGVQRQPAQSPFNPVNITTEKLTATGK